MEEDFLCAVQLINLGKEKGAEHQGSRRNLYKVKCELKYGIKLYCMEHYFEVHKDGKAALWDDDLHKIQLSFRVTEFLVRPYLVVHVSFTAKPKLIRAMLSRSIRKVSLIIKMIEKHSGVQLYCITILSAIHALLGTLLSISSRSTLVDAMQYSAKMVSEENLSSLGDLVNEVAEMGLPDWFARTKLIDCICTFALLEPRIAQAMIGRLFAMFQDTDYRVRLFLGRKVGILFQTWDGHDELFHDN